MLHMYEDFRIAAALTNAFHIPLVDNIHAAEFIGIIRNRVNTPNHLADYVEARNLNRHRIEFNNISGHLPHLPHFPVLTEDELILFSVGTYQLKLAASYYSEHIRSGDYIIEIYANNDDIPDLNNFDLPTTNIWLLRSRIRSRHSSSKTYFCYLLVDENLRGIESIKQLPVYQQYRSIDQTDTTRQGRHFSFFFMCHFENVVDASSRASACARRCNVTVVREMLSARRSELKCSPLPLRSKWTDSQLDRFSGGLSSNWTEYSREP
ncbi:Uncharacterized protein OBRU01_17179 [Operophtera brumata]|uniref:Uncharacterized protein n=1 Tax=Operophtera brumata TaxID=104452 RepID=A0A0L7L194_OPEBR|nr:Uncharacterized protein OBRU01_17179 [Operophtera brumata]